MSDGLEDNDTANPAVQEVEIVKRNAHEPDHGVVAASQKEKRNHVQHGQDSSAADGSADEDFLVGPINLPDRKDDVEGKVANEPESLHAPRKNTNVDSGRQSKLAVVSSSEKRGDNEVPLDLGPCLVGDTEVALSAVAGGAVVQVG